MGVVILAHDQELDRSVAIKVISIKPVPEVLARFEREARVLSRLDHPHVMRLYLADPWGEPPYLVTEFVSGSDLHRTPPENPVEVMLQVAEGLAAVHRLEVVHRDVKPANILLTDGSRAVLADFGLVSGDDTEDITRTNVLVGTMIYLAPELLWGGEATPASDWYAWGASLYQLMEGRPPYSIDTLQGVLAGEELPEPEFETLPRDGRVAQVIRTCLLAHAESRPAGLGTIRAMLADPGPDPEDEVRPSPPPSRPARDEKAASQSGATEVASPGAAADAGESRLARSARPAGVIAVLVFSGLLSLYGLRNARAPKPSPPSPPPEPSSPSLVSPGDSHLEAAIAEFEAALDSVGRGPSRATVPLQEAYHHRGVRVFAQLPRTMELIRWLQANEVSGALRQRLESHDRSLEALGMLPLLRPFLTTTPLAPPKAFPETLRTWAATRSSDVGKLQTRAPSWTVAALVHLGRGLEAHAATSRVLRSRGPGGRGSLREYLAGLPQELTRKLPQSMDLLQGVPALRPALDEVLAPGRSATRSFLFAAMQAAEEEPELSASFRHLWVAGASRLRVLLSGAFFDPPLALLFPDAPGSFPGRHLAVQVLRDARQRVRGLGRPGAPSPRGEELRWVALHEVARTPYERKIVLQGYLATAEAYRLGGDRAGVRAVLQRLDTSLRAQLDVESGPYLARIEDWLSRPVPGNGSIRPRNRPR
jgi:serine/threonine protein kinase